MVTARMGTECNFALGLADVLMIPWAFQASLSVWANPAAAKAKQTLSRNEIQHKKRMCVELIAKPPGAVRLLD
jgi:hypothetical protein